MATKFCIRFCISTPIDLRLSRSGSAIRVTGATLQVWCRRVMATIFGIRICNGTPIDLRLSRNGSAIRVTGATLQVWCRRMMANYFFASGFVSARHRPSASHKRQRDPCARRYLAGLVQEDDGNHF
jgi:hypothetical protein